VRYVSAAGAVVVSALVLYLSFFGFGLTLPPLGPAFNPSTGAWTMASDAASTGSQTLHLAGLTQPVRVVLEADGTAHIVASTDHDLFLATGYVHAKFRLFQMDLLRRQGEGRLSEVFGKAALDTDTFELQLGLLRTAQVEWSQLSATDPSRIALEAYAQGVNDRIDEAERTHQLPAMFTLSNYQPARWTPIDSLVVKGDMTQTLNFTDTPLVMAQLEKTLGPDLTTEWFPVLPPNQQSPYDPGPYAPNTGVAHIPPLSSEATGMQPAVADSALALYQRLDSLPAGLIAHGGDSNNWAVAPSRSATGGALLAGDPHLHLTLPSIWYQLSMDSPSYHVSGVSIPGTPVVLIGHNQHIAWSLTDAQNQQTFFYDEQEDSAHPGMYLWNGQWTKYKYVSYDIPVAGGKTQHLTVKYSVHGPVISERGLTTSVWWAGNIPSQDLSVLLRLDRAANFDDFRGALKDWLSPTHNFVYADDQGNIGLISAGYYPQVARGTPWLPMPGTGEYDVTGTIPYDQIPQIYNPPSGVVWSANQRQVTGQYPFYIGTATNFFDPGYRANEIAHTLNEPGKKFTAADMMALQTDTNDYLAAEMVPQLLNALAAAQLSPTEEQVHQELAGWNTHMDVDSVGATVWWIFWQEYLSGTFDPWWKSHNVKIDRSELNDALTQDLEAWTLRDPTNPAFTLVGATQNAGDMMVQSFHAAVALLTTRLGADPTKWTWGRVHQRTLENLALISGLDYGPVPDRGDAYTPLAAPDFPSTHGPSWRMVVDWGSDSFSGVYPGGQSENPASGWYSNRAQEWFDGRYSPMLDATHAAAAAGASTWTLES
jgi:penicillin G amidase